jgi:hypothetical protein
LTTLIVGDESTNCDERMRARRNQIALLQAGNRMDTDKKKCEQKAAKAARTTERAARSGPKRRRKGQHTVDEENPVGVDGVAVEEQHTTASSSVDVVVAPGDEQVAVDAAKEKDAGEDAGEDANDVVAPGSAQATVDDAEGVQGAAEVAVPRRGFIWPTESFKHPAYPVTFVAGGRYRSTGTSFAHLPPSVSEVDVYTACERGCYFHSPRDDIVYFDPPPGVKPHEVGADRCGRLRRDDREAHDPQRQR